MKVVIIGGTGLIGSKVVSTLKEQGHEAVPASPDTGVHTKDHHADSASAAGRACGNAGVVREARKTNSGRPPPWVQRNK